MIQMLFLKKLYKKILPERIRVQIWYLLFKLRSVFYFGNKVYCNVCKNSFRKFLPKGRIIRLNAECPYCGSLERTRLLLLYLEKETRIFSKGTKVLHIAPELGLYKLFKKMDIEYIDGDINPAFATHVVDITSIQYPDNYFNYIICSHVLGHIPDEAKAVEELYRVTAINGIALIMTLLNPENNITYENPLITDAKDRLMHYGEPDLCRLHGMDFAQRLQNGGFKVTVIDYRNQVPAELHAKGNFGDGKREIIFKCEKNR